MVVPVSQLKRYLRSDIKTNYLKRFHLDDEINICFLLIKKEGLAI